MVARACFLLTSVITIFVASYLAYGQGRFNEAENILIGFMAVNYLLYDGKFRYVGFLLIYVVLITLKFLKQGFLGDYDLNFYLTLQNISILCFLVFLFSEAFRNSLLKAFVRLKEKDELLYLMIDNVPLFIALIDKEMKYRMVNINYEKSFGKTREQIIGSHISEVLPVNILEKHGPMIERGLQGESPEFLELTEMPDGRSFYAGGKYVPVLSDSGDIVGVSVFVNDVTKLEEAKNKLSEANSTKDKMLSILSHDIRGPLDLFEGLLAYSSDGSLSQDDFLKHQLKVRGKLTDLRKTVNTLLDWARTQLDGVNIASTSTDVDEVVKSNLELYQELIHKKEIKVQVAIEADAVAWVDANHLKIGIRNMLHNSLKFTPKGGNLTVIGSRAGDKVQLTLEDDGIGMSQEKVDSIMKKELQTSKFGTEGESGTGLGLSLSLELLEKNNCEVKIESGEKKGTKIVIEMQASKE